jgi:hypothetical protein
MSDSRPAYDEQLPWLEAVDDEDGPRGVSARRMLAALAVVLVAAMLVAGTFYWLGQRTAIEGGAPELIRAEPGPYKVRPDNPGGLDVAGQGETAYVTSVGEDPDAKLDLGAIPDQPAVRPEPEPRPAPSAEPSEPAPDKPTGGAGSVIQLGAYTSAGQAQRGWDALSARFPTLKGATKLIIPFSGGYRLRAGTGSPEEARQACQMLKAAGEACFIAN